MSDYYRKARRDSSDGRLWTAAIERAVARVHGFRDPKLDLDELRSERIKALDFMATQFVLEMDKQRGLDWFREFGDRVEGRPAQAVQLTGADEGPIELKAVEWNLVRPEPKD